MTLWGGRFSEPTDDDLRKLNDSLEFDQILYKQDIIGSMAYARAIADAGVLTQEEADVIVQGLEQVLAEFDAGTFVVAPGDEDIHTAVERRLTEIVGAVGGKLHTGRSRNDQVATDFRLWVMDTIRELDSGFGEMQNALVGQAESHTETLLPGYTHVQPAQPITIAHWLMSFFWMIARDRERLRDSYGRTSVMPLGSGALAGIPFPIDRENLASELGFSAYSQNSLDAVSDRDYVAEFLFSLSLFGVHLSRLAEDIIYYSNPAFGYIRLNDRYSTGSSIMPQKRNADPMELARGKAGRMIGNLAGFLTTLKGLPSGYNKDIQEDKEALIDSVNTILNLLPVAIAIVRTLTIDAQAARRALTEEILATELADYLVRKGMPFRQAHGVVGQVVRIAADSEIQMSDIDLDTLVELSDLFDDDVAEVFDFDLAVARKNTVGGTAPEAVRQQIENAKSWLNHFEIQ